MTTKNVIEALATHCLSRAPDANESFDGEDMCNAFLIFQYVLVPLLQDHCEKLGFTLAQKAVIATEAGMNIHQTVLLATGIDLKDHVGGSWPETIGENE